MKWCLICTAIVCVYLLASPAPAVTITENFDGFTSHADVLAAGWDAYGAEGPGNFIVSNGTDTWGHEDEGFLTNNTDQDRSLGYAKTAVGETGFITHDLPNTYGGAMSNFSGEFDFELNWIRVDPREAFFRDGMQYRTNGSGAWNTVLSSGAIGVLATGGNPLMQWFTDAEMDGGNLANRDIAFSIAGLTLQPGDVLNLRWGGVGTSSGIDDRNTLRSIDNFELSFDVQQGAIIPEPGTLIVWSLLAAMGIGVAWRRRRS